MTARTTICADKLNRMLSLASTVSGQTRPERATVLRLSRINDEAGGFIETWEPALTDIPARVTAQGMQPWEKVDKIGGRVVAISVFLIAFPARTDVRVTDRIRIETLEGTPEYEVLGVNGPASFEVERTAQAVRVQ